MVLGNPDSAVMLPLSLAQHKIWVAQQAAAEAPIYNLLASYEIHGQINTARFVEACDLTVADSDILQTIFVVGKDHEVRQKRDRSIQSDCQIIQCSPDVSIEQYSRQQGLHPLDLARRCFRFSLFVYPLDRTVFHISIHHLISDGGLLSLLWNQITRHYYFLEQQGSMLKSSAGIIRDTREDSAGGVDGDFSCRPEPFIPYAEHVLQEQRFLQSPEHLKLLEYWENRSLQSAPVLAWYRAPGLIDSVVNDPREEYKVTRCEWNPNAEILSQLQRVRMEREFAGRSDNMSLFVALATVMLVTAYRIEGNSRQRLGYPARSRSSRQFKDALGLFISEGFLDLQLTPDDTFATVALRVAKSVTDGLDHLSTSIQSIRINRAFSSSLNIILATANSFGELPVSAATHSCGYSDVNTQFDLHVTDLSGTGEYSFKFDFSDRYFSPQNQQRYIQHFQSTISALVDDCRQSIATFPFLAKAEQKQLLLMAGTDSVDTDSGASVCQLLRATTESETDNNVVNQEDRSGFSVMDIAACFEPGTANKAKAGSLGRPVAGINVFIVDKNFQLMPRGAIGELALAGVALQSGFIDPPEPWRERLSENPFGQGKLLLSGHLGRLDSKGLFELHGLAGELLSADNTADEVDVSSIYVAQNETESLLQSLYKKVLLRDHIDLTADFFALGGNSLHAMKLVSAAKLAGIEIQLKDILAGVGLRTLAKQLQSSPTNVSAAITQKSIDPQYLDPTTTGAELLAGPDLFSADSCTQPHDRSFPDLDSINNTRRDYDFTKDVVDRIRQQANVRQDFCAVRFEQTELGYRELMLRCDRLAAYLQGQGIQARMVVGLYLPRSVDLLIGMIAVIRLGAAYIPIDPDFPQQRVHHIFNDSGMDCLLTLGSQSHWKDIWSGPVVLLDVESSEIEYTTPLTGPDGIATGVQAEDMAYMIYTSGSTGAPKGVGVSRRNMTNFLCSMLETPGIKSTDVLLAVTTISFDISVLELFLPLLAGATVDIAPRQLVRDAIALKAYLQQADISVMQATPTTWRLLLMAGWKGHRDFKCLVGGEALDTQLSRSLIPRCGELWNMYGPTETTVWSTCGKVTSGDSVISIGRPIANTRIYIVDKDDRLCAVNEPGELCIAGDGVSMGYHNRGNLNRLKFVDLPDLDSGDGCVFRTGDLARWNSDHSLECLGRIDRQLKLHGYRIEPAEIESRLLRLPDVCAAVVELKMIGHSKELIAYLIVEGKQSNTAIDEQKTRLCLSEYLPEYMLPTRFMVIPEVPLLPNGKIDRAALPDPVAPRLAESAPLADPDRISSLPLDKGTKAAHKNSVVHDEADLARIKQLLKK